MLTPIRRRAALAGLSVCATLATMGPASAAPLVTIETVGDEIVGRLESLDMAGGVLLDESGGSRLNSRDVLKIVFEEPSRSATDVAALGEVELVDGSRFEYVGASFEEEVVRFELRGGVLAATPVTNIAAWKIGSDDTLDVTPTNGASDVLVVKRRDGGYAPVEGVVVELNSDGVRFALEADDGAEPVEAPWERIGGIRFYRTQQQSGERRAMVTLVDGGRVVTDEVRYADGQVRWSQGGAPVEAVASINLSSGRVTAVKELKLLADEYAPYFPEEDAAKAKGYAFDESLLGGQLTLRYPDRRAPEAWPGLSVRREFARGVALRSRGELRLELPEGAQRLRGVIGLDPSAANAGSAEVRIVADDKTLWSSIVDGETAPATIDEPLSNAKVLTLQVDYGDNLDAGDFINFCELRVIR